MLLRGFAFAPLGVSNPLLGRGSVPVLDCVELKLAAAVAGRIIPRVAPLQKLEAFDGIGAPATDTRLSVSDVAVDPAVWDLPASPKLELEKLVCGGNAVDGPGNTGCIAAVPLKLKPEVDEAGCGVRNSDMTRFWSPASSPSPR